MTKKDNEMLQLGGLWVNESKKGEKYMVGYLGNLRLLVFKNKFKKEEKHPNYIMYLAAQDYDKESTDGDEIMDEDISF